MLIGGDYATGRELAQLFLPSGPRGGLLAMALATVVFSLVCVLTFLFARETRSNDYRTFIKRLLGLSGVSFEAAYCVFPILILAVFGWPAMAGMLLLTALIAPFTALSDRAVERLSKYVSILLCSTQALFLLLCPSRFSDRIAGASSRPTPIRAGCPRVSGSLSCAAHGALMPSGEACL